MWVINSKREISFMCFSSNMIFQKEIFQGMVSTIISRQCKIYVVLDEFFSYQLCNVPLRCGGTDPGPTPQVTTIAQHTTAEAVTSQAAILQATTVQGTTTNANNNDFVIESLFVVQLLLVIIGVLIVCIRRRGRLRTVRKRSRG